MIWIAFAAAVSDQGEFGASMNRYMACLSAGLPSDLTHRDLQARAGIYRKAAARCQGEREGAIDAAIRNRTPSQSEGQARAQAIDIIDTLDPLSSCKVPGSQC
jgi:hypothetical protein